MLQPSKIIFLFLLNFLELSVLVKRERERCESDSVAGPFFTFPVFGLIHLALIPYFCEHEAIKGRAEAAR